MNYRYSAFILLFNLIQGILGVKFSLVDINDAQIQHTVNAFMMDYQSRLQFMFAKASKREVISAEVI